MDYMQLTLPYSSLGDLPPFEVLYGHAPRTLWSWKQSNRPAVDDLNIDNARTYARHNREVLEYTCNTIQKVQERISKVVNQHRRPIDFDIGDYVWLDI
jgi:hypothetical protein